MSTWSYTIMGNSEAYKFWAKYSEFIWSFVDISEIATSRGVSDERLQCIIREGYEDLVGLAIKQKSRLANQVLGVYLMDHGAKMTNALKELILLNSRWEEERDQLFSETDRAERFHYLSEFCEKIRYYVSGVKTKISWETGNQVVERLREEGLITDNYPFVIAPEKVSIDHTIK